MNQTRKCVYNNEIFMGKVYDIIQDRQTTNMNIQFTDHTKKLDGEGCSKSLNVDSELVKHLQKVRELLHELFPNETIKGADRKWHIELIHRSKRGDNPEHFLTHRAGSLQNKTVDAKCTLSYTVMNKKALVLTCPKADGYGFTHITIGYFPDGIDPPKLTKIYDALQEKGLANA